MTLNNIVILKFGLQVTQGVKVTKNGTIRKLGYSFLFAFHSNDGPILYPFRDEVIYWPKIAIFRTPCIRRPR